MEEVVFLVLGGGLFFYVLMELLGIRHNNSVKPKTQEEWEQEQTERKKQYRKEQGKN